MRHNDEIEDLEEIDDNDDNGKAEEFIIFVDGEEVEVESRILTANQILRLSEIDPSTHFLKLTKGGKEENYKGDERVKLHPKMEFISIYKGSTKVA